MPHQHSAPLIEGDYMPPRSRVSPDSFFDHVGRGFWFAVGFTPVFVLICLLMSFVFMKLTADSLASSASNISYQKQAEHIINQSPPVQGLKQVLPQLQVPVAEIGPAHSLSVKEQQEKACNMAILQFSQTNSDPDKQRMYQLCPE